MDVFLQIGQSNAVGRGLIAEASVGVREFFPDFMTWIDGAFTQLDLSTRTTQGNEFGPEIMFAQDLEDAQAETLYHVKKAQGGTSAKVEWQPGGSMYTAAVTDCNAAIALLKSWGLSPEVSILWQQGEDDVASATYATDEAAIWAGLEVDLQAPIFRIFNGLLSVNQEPIVDETERNNINNAKSTVAAANANISLIDTSSVSTYPADRVHFNAAGVETLGSAYATSFLSFIS